MGRVWTWIADRRRWAEATLVYTALQLLTFMLPQAPTLPKSSPAFTRWLAGIRSVFGDRTGMWADLGLFTLRSSLLLRLTLGVIGLLAAVQIGYLWEHRQTRSVGERRRTVILSLSGIVLLAGWFAHIRWGWVESGVITWDDQPIVIRDRQLNAIQSRGRVPFWTQHYGLYLVPEGERTGLTIRALDAAGDPLSLLSSVRDDPKVTLRSVLTDQSPEAFFAVPDAGMIFRISQWQNQVQVQAYRSASGELLAETPLPSDTSLSIEDVTLDIETQSLSRYRAVYNPGAVFEGLGVLGIVVILLSGGSRQATTESREGSKTSDDSEENAAT